MWTGILSHYGKYVDKFDVILYNISMSSYVDTKFLNQLSNRLFKLQTKETRVFGILDILHCGDSKKSKTKSRGFVYEKKNNLFFKWYNCGMGQSLGNFIKFLDERLYKEYVLERYKDANLYLCQTSNRRLLSLKKIMFKKTYSI